MKYTRKQRATRRSAHRRSLRHKSGGAVEEVNKKTLTNEVNAFGKQFVGNVGSRPWNKANTQKNKEKQRFKNALTTYLKKVIASDKLVSESKFNLITYKKNDIIEFYKNSNKTTKYTGKVIDDPKESNGDFKYKVQITKIGNNSPEANIYNTITSKNIISSD